MGLFIGFETLSDETLRAVGKRTNHPEEYLDVVRRIHDHGIGIDASFVFGLDGDDEGVFDRTLEFVERAKVEIAYYSILTPYPGTRLHERLTKEGRILTQDWSLYDTSHVVYRPQPFTPDQLLAGYYRVLKESFSLGSIFRRLWGTTAYKPFFYPMNLGFRQSARALCRAYRKGRMALPGQVPACAVNRALSRPTNQLLECRRASWSPAPALSARWASAGSATRKGSAPAAPRFGPVSLFDVSRQRVRTGGGSRLPATLPATRLTPRQAARIDRAGAMLLLAGQEAWAQAGWEPAEDLPLVLGTTAGGMSLGEAYFRTAVQTPHRHRQQPTRALHYQAQMPGAHPRRSPGVQRADHHHFERLRLGRQRHRARLATAATRPG